MRACKQLTEVKGSGLKQLAVTTCGQGSQQHLEGGWGRIT